MGSAMSLMNCVERLTNLPHRSISIRTGPSGITAFSVTVVHPSGLATQSTIGAVFVESFALGDDAFGTIRIQVAVSRRR